MTERGVIVLFSKFLIVCSLTLDEAVNFTPAAWNRLLDSLQLHQQPQKGLAGLVRLGEHRRAGLL